MIEAELKACVREPERIRQALRALSAEETRVYHDTYYDWPDGALTRADRELRVRVIDGGDGERRRCLLTYKDAAADPESGSKPEWETEVAEPDTIDAILRGIGFERHITFEKHCTNYAFQSDGRQLQATLARVPELDGSFLEVETLVEDRTDLQAALDGIRRILDGLRIPERDLTTVLYTDSVRRRRGAAGQGP